MPGPVGGFTSVLEIKPDAAGFNASISLLNSLYDQLKKIKDLAGNIGNMKLTVKFEGLENSSDQANKVKAQKERELRSQGLMPVKLNRESINPSMSIKKHWREVEEQNNDAWKQKNQKQKETNKNLTDFSSALKWLTGLLLSGEFARSVFKSMESQQATAFGASGFNMSPKAYYDLQNVSRVFANDKGTSFDSLLNKLQGFQTNPQLRGDLDKNFATLLKTGAGVNVDTDFIGKTYEQNLTNISNSLLKRMNSKDDKTRLGAIETAKELGIFDVLQGVNTNGGGSIGSAIGKNNAMTVGVDFSASSKVLTELNETFLFFKNQMDHLTSNLSEDILSPMKRINDFLSSNKDTFKEVGDEIGDLLGLLVSLLSGDANNMMMIFNKRQKSLDDNNEKILGKTKAGQLKSLGISPTFDLNDKLDKNIENDLTRFNKIQSKLMKSGSDVTGLSDSVKKDFGNVTSGTIDWLTGQPESNLHGDILQMMQDYRKRNQQSKNPSDMPQGTLDLIKRIDQGISYTIPMTIHVHGNMDNSMSERMKQVIADSFGRNVTANGMNPGMNQSA